MYRALISFSGKISMAEGEIRDISEKDVVGDLLDAGYIEEITPAKPEPKAKPKAEPKAEPKPEEKVEEKPKKKSTRKKKTTSKK